MSRKRLFLCGDSWMSPIIGDHSPDLNHFGEHLANMLDYELVRFSQQGTSNGGICIQIETALREGADFILTDTTTTERVEIPFAYKAKLTEPFDTKEVEFDVLDLFHGNWEKIMKQLNRQEYQPQLASNNILSILTHGFSGHQTWSQEHFKPYEREAKEKLKYFEDWCLHLYHAEWKRQIDIYSQYAVLHKLHLSGIPFILTLDFLGIEKHCTWLEQKNKCHIWTWLDNAMGKVKIEREKGTWVEHGFHTKPDDQKDAARLLLQHIQNYNLIK